MEITADASIFLSVVLNETDKSWIRAFDMTQKIPVRLVPVNIYDAMKLAMRLNLSASDACSLQCCLENRLPLLSLDGRMCAAAKRLKIKVVE